MKEEGGWPEGFSRISGVILELARLTRRALAHGTRPSVGSSRYNYPSLSSTKVRGGERSSSNVQ